MEQGHRTDMIELQNAVDFQGAFFDSVHHSNSLLHLSGFPGFSCCMVMFIDFSYVYFPI